MEMDNRPRVVGDVARFEEPGVAEKLQYQEKWEEVIAGQFRFTVPGDTIIGILRGKEKSSTYDVGVYHVETHRGVVLSFLGTTTLDRQMGQVPIGSMVKVVFGGTEKTKSQRDMKKFSVSYRKATDILDVPEPEEA